MKIENENTFKNCLQKGINLFLGAGFSVEAKGIFEEKPKAMPVGDGLRKEILKEFGRDEKSPLSLSQLCQIISKTRRDALNDFLRKRFTVVEFGKMYGNLERINIKAIFTTNIDDLVFKIFEGSQRYYVNDISLRGPSIVGSSAIDYIALHGSVVHASEGMDFSPVEIASSFERDKDKWYGYIGRVQQTPTLYWGYSIADAGVLQALAKETINGRERAPAWVTLRAEDDEAIEYYSSLGFQIIVAETSDLLKLFGQLKIDNISDAPKSLIDKRFSEYLIPTVNKVPVRTLAEFYLGAEPTWYDIFLGNLHKTKHFYVAQNSIAGNKNCLLIGAAVTGKSTLLKLLANSVPDNVQSLFIEDITPEKARLLIKDIDEQGAKVIAFIDNAADAWEAIGILSVSNNIQIVAAERDYIFDSVAHRFARGKFDIFDVSGLSLLDVQAVQDKIPSGVQRLNTQKFYEPLSVDFDPTFFEVLDSSIVGHLLADRFIDALKNLKKEAPAKHDLLLLSCYLYSCRIPTSVDVASSFLSKLEANPMAVYQLLISMTSLLSQYEGGLAETDQAFFVPRSRSVAEAVIKRVEPSDLRRLLIQFHSEVSTTKIPRYDIFRRMAYDANLITRAFPNWEEGLDFYEKCFDRDRSPSFKQQGALYLSRKRQYQLAFKWIDDAMAMAGRRRESVRNTYAVIMFNANYDKSDSAPGVITTLDESMQILQKCYTDDLRKVYHAKVFADQAVKYAAKFSDSPSSLEYLDQAIMWLNAELQSRQGDRSINQLLRDLKSARRNLSL
ncbi:SIR2 family protein [Methylobacter sp.]|uniref:SIR2 family protein n=1 Tax=Methylobacter sp. TaxID=2051955 RepID=UPI003DA5CCE5